MLSPNGSRSKWGGPDSEDGESEVLDFEKEGNLKKMAGHRLEKTNFKLSREDYQQQKPKRNSKNPLAPKGRVADARLPKDPQELLLLLILVSIKLS